MRVNDYIIIYVVIQHSNCILLCVPNIIDAVEMYKNETQWTFMVFIIVDHSNKLFAIVAVSLL